MKQSLVESETLAVASDIGNYFSQSDTPEFVSRKTAIKLLRSAEHLLALALQEVEVEPGLPLMQLARNNRRHLTGTLNHEHLLMLNQSPFIRSMHTFTVAKKLGANTSMVAQAVEVADIQPHVPKIPKGIDPSNHGRTVPRHYYDKDQFLAIESGLSRVVAPDTYIPESIFLKRVKIGTATLEAYKKSLGIISPVLLNPIINKSESFITKIDAHKILMHIREQRLAI